MSGLAATFLAGKFGAKRDDGRPRQSNGLGGRDAGNFRAIYGQSALRAEFRLFLDNVFHLYPTRELDELIAECVQKDPRDFAVTRELEARLSEVTPLFSSVRYALPALAKQKSVMAVQTKELVGGRRGFEGYLELGSHGRYFDALKDELDLRGPVFTSAPTPPTRSPADVVDRGALGFRGTPLPWTDYAPLRGVQGGSLDLVTVFIGFHHAEVGARVPLFRSIREALSGDGLLIVRDHDVVSPELAHLVGLAHDVFNVGTHETFETNQRERRNFYPLEALVKMLEAEGFSAHKKRLLQAGDPTHNTLMAFSKA